METQVKSARAKQQNYAKGQRKALDLRPSSGPAHEIEHSRRLFLSGSNKRAIARFAKGPADTGGFTYPRRRVLPGLGHFDEKPSSLIPMLDDHLKNPVISEPASEPSELGNVEQVVVEENFCVVTEPRVESPVEPDSKSFKIDLDVSESTELVLESPQIADDFEPSEPVLEGEEDIVVYEDVSVACVELEECTHDTESIAVETDEFVDVTVGPGDRSSENESSEDENEETIKLASAKPANTLKPKSSPVVVRKAIVPVSPVYRKVAPPTSPTRSSWSKFLPLVIEIKATIPYPMHMLGLTILLVVGVLLRLLYQFGSDLGGEMELQGQMVRLLKLGLLFAVVIMCVNFVEENKELQHKDLVSPVQPKVRPSKMSKNKKKMMMKV